MFNLKKLIIAAQSGDKEALTILCNSFEPLFKSEMRREMFYNALGMEEGLSLARLKFIEADENKKGLYRAVQPFY